MAGNFIDTLFLEVIEMNTKHYCCRCDVEGEFIIKEEVLSKTIDDVTFEYTGQIPYCNTCGTKIDIALLNDQNMQFANRKYREFKEIIQIEEIKELIDQYEIGQKPLAALLGWGEVTIVRYLKGATPRLIYSNQLKELKDPNKMLELFESNKNVLSEATRKRVYNRLIHLVQVQRDFQPSDIARFFLSKIDVDGEEVITPMKLQKLVYYAQGWLLAFQDRAFFKDEIEAWVHGPVIPNLYDEYKKYGSGPIPKVEKFNESIFNVDEVNILTMVRNIYGRYDGKYLEYLVHNEAPWIEARGKCVDHDKCDRTIKEGQIVEYFKGIKKKFKINSIKDLVRLSNLLFLNR